MASIRDDQPLRVCASCGSWVQPARAICPWCGTAVAPAASGEPTAGAIAARDRLARAEATTIHTLAADAGAAPLGDDAPTLTLQREAAQRPSPPARRGRRFWARSFALTFLVVLLALVGLGALGIYQGINDRTVQNRREAIALYDEGTAFLDGGRYELAIAAFQEALRLEPALQAAEIRLAEAQRLADEALGITPEAATPTAVPPNNDETLFEDAAAALAEGDWEIAAATFDLLAAESPDFRADEVAEGLYAARLAAGRAAVQARDLDSAIRHFEQALAIRPDSDEAQRLRRISAAYRAGRAAWEREAWDQAADQLRVAYLIDPAFLDTARLLAQAHLARGQALEARSIWCEAAQEYRASRAIVDSARVAALADTAADRCEVRVAAPPPTPRATDEPEIVFVPTFDANPTATPALSPTLPLTVTTPTPAATPSRPAPTATRPAPAFPFTLAGGVGEDLSDGCGGHYIRGTVRAPDGAPLPGVTILAVDEFGNRFSAVSKADPAGVYDIPISGQKVAYQVWVAGATPLSPVIAVQHTDRHAQEPQACHILNWQQSP